VEGMGKGNGELLGQKVVDQVIGIKGKANVKLIVEIRG
jgi:hypothetical protein